MNQQKEEKTLFKNGTLHAACEKKMSVYLFIRQDNCYIFILNKSMTLFTYRLNMAKNSLLFST